MLQPATFGLIFITSYQAITADTESELSWNKGEMSTIPAAPSLKIHLHGLATSVVHVIQVATRKEVKSSKRTSTSSIYPLNGRPRRLLHYVFKTADIRLYPMSLLHSNSKMHVMYATLCLKIIQNIVCKVTQKPLSLRIVL